ncbi:MAG: glycosyltransferase, partial [Pseudomonadota bacterium]
MIRKQVIRLLPYLAGARAKLTDLKFRHYQRRTARALKGLTFGPSRLQDPPLVTLIAIINDQPAVRLQAMLDSFLKTSEEAPAQLLLIDAGSSTIDTLDWIRRAKQIDNVRCLSAKMGSTYAQAFDEGLAQATGEFVAALPADAVLTPKSLLLICRALAENPRCELLYTDHAVATATGRVSEVILKPAYDPVLMLHRPYLEHLCLYRRDALARLVAIPQNIPASLAHTYLYMRYCQAANRENVIHLPYPAVEIASSEIPPSLAVTRARRERERIMISDFAQHDEWDTYVQQGADPSVHRIRRFKPNGDWPIVNIIIPHRNAPDRLRKLMQGLVSCTDYPGFRIVFVDGGSDDQQTLDIYASFTATHPNITLVQAGQDASLSASMNLGMSQHADGHL